MYRTTLGVEGMMCSMCEQHVREAVQKALERNLIEAKKVTASKSRKEVVVIAEHPVDERLMRSAVEVTGYETTHFRSEPHVEHGLFGRIASIFGRA